MNNATNPHALIPVSFRQNQLDIRERVVQYQEECFVVLNDYWTKGRAVNPRKANTPAGFPEEVRSIFDFINAAEAHLKKGARA